MAAGATVRGQGAQIGSLCLCFAERALSYNGRTAAAVFQACAGVAGGHDHVPGINSSCRTSSTPSWQHLAEFANMQGMVEMKDCTFVAAAARQRHAPGGGPGLFVGRRVFLTVAPATSGGGRSSSTSSAGKVALVAQMVAAEGGTLVRALGQGESGGGRGAASPSPSPEGATLLVCVAQGVNEARMGLRMGQVGVMRGSEGAAECWY